MQTLIPPSRLIINSDLDTNMPIIGVDEVGRGCLFGHMSVAAVLLPPHLAMMLADMKDNENVGDFLYLNDSKKISPKKREKLAHLIHQHASYAVVDISHTLIDNLNIHHATLLGMQSAISALVHAAKLQHTPTTVLIDGVFAPKITELPLKIHTLAKGDALHASIACASIIAKTTRDKAMKQYHAKYPQFGIERHKGYPTALHKAALQQFGILPEHRRSFAPIKSLLSQ